MGRHRCIISSVGEFAGEVGWIWSGALPAVVEDRSWRAWGSPRRELLSAQDWAEIRSLRRAEGCRSR